MLKINNKLKKLFGRLLTGRDYVRFLVRKRDNFKCKKCKTKWNKGNRQFDVHHLNGLCGKKSKAYDKITEIDGLITLCHRCHLNLHSVREKMIASHEK